MSIQLSTTLVKLTPGNIGEAIVYARNLMAERVDAVITKQVSIGNDEYSIQVDGKPAYSRNSIYFAKKSIQVSFLGGISEIAVGAAIQVLEMMIQRYWPETLTNKDYPKIMPGSVTAWLNERGKAPIEITSSYSVRLAQNQFITITAKMPTGSKNPIPLANFLAHQKSGRGFYFRAAQNIRRRLGIDRRRGAVRVAALRLTSTKTVQPKGTKEYAWSRPPKFRIPANIATTTNWIIVIEPRLDSTRRLRG